MKNQLCAVRSSQANLNAFARDFLYRILIVFFVLFSSNAKANDWYSIDQNDPYAPVKRSVESPSSCCSIRAPDLSPVKSKESIKTQQQGTQQKELSYNKKKHQFSTALIVGKFQQPKLEFKTDLPLIEDRLDPIRLKDSDRLSLID